MENTEFTITMRVLRIKYRKQRMFVDYEITSGPCKGRQFTQAFESAPAVATRAQSFARLRQASAYGLPEGTCEECGLSYGQHSQSCKKQEKVPS